MAHVYFGGKGGADKYRKMMGTEKYPGEHNVSRSKSEWREFYKGARAKKTALGKKLAGKNIVTKEQHDAYRKSIGK